MNSIITFEPTTQVTMTSLELVAFINDFRRDQAEEAGVEFPSKGYAELQHKDFLEKVPLVLGERSAEFSADLPDSYGRSRKAYCFPKREACLMAMSYSYEIQAAVYDRMTALEQERMFAIPKTMSEALRLAADLADENAVLAIENKEKDKVIGELKAKGDYVDWVLSVKGTVPTTLIASDYGMSAQAFNKMLHDYKVQYKIAGMWVLYAPKYKDKGYMQTVSI